MVTVRNKSDTPNDEYENFLTAHMEAAAECIPTKPRTKCRVSWESQVVRKKNKKHKNSILT